MTFVSFAQNFEDVILWRALRHVEHGQYLDIGAQDPVLIRSVWHFTRRDGAAFTSRLPRIIPQDFARRVVTKSSSRQPQLMRPARSNFMRFRIPEYPRAAATWRCSISGRGFIRKRS